MNFKTETRIEDDYVVIDVYENGNYSMEYYFKLNDYEYFLNEHLPGKNWVTESNLKEISSTIWNQLANS